MTFILLPGKSLGEVPPSLLPRGLLSSHRQLVLGFNIPPLLGSVVDLVGVVLVEVVEALAVVALVLFIVGMYLIVSEGQSNIILYFLTKWYPTIMSLP